MSENLRYAFTTVVPNELCQQFYPLPYVRNDTMCTTGHGNSLQTGCFGDEGGALVANIDGVWYQIGVVSTIHGSGCTGVYPNLHTKITPYLQWISHLTGIPINP